MQEIFFIIVILVIAVVGYAIYKQRKQSTPVVVQTPVLPEKTAAKKAVKKPIAKKAPTKKVK